MRPLVLFYYTILTWYPVTCYLSKLHRHKNKCALYIVDIMVPWRVYVIRMDVVCILLMVKCTSPCRLGCCCCYWIMTSFHVSSSTTRIRSTLYMTSTQSGLVMSCFRRLFTLVLVLVDDGHMKQRFVSCPYLPCSHPNVSWNCQRKELSQHGLPLMKSTNWYFSARRSIFWRWDDTVSCITSNDVHINSIPGKQSETSTLGRYLLCQWEFPLDTLA